MSYNIKYCGPEVESDDFEKFREEQLNISEEALSNLSRYIEMLVTAQSQLSVSVKEISEHLSKGNINDQEVNSRLWHDLYGVQHRTRNICVYGVESLKEFSTATESLISHLEKMRPPKD